MESVAFPEIPYKARTAAPGQDCQVQRQYLLKLCGCHSAIFRYKKKRGSCPSLNSPWWPEMTRCAMTTPSLACSAISMACSLAARAA